MSRGDEQENPGECEACGFETDALESYPMTRLMPKEEGTKWLCRLCAETMCGMAYEYPEQFGGQFQTMRTICYCTNVVLAALEAKKP